MEVEDGCFSRNRHPAVTSDSAWYQFSHWSGYIDSSEPSDTTILHGDANITAIFETKNYNSVGIVINEINYNSAADFDTEDWIELYAVNGDHDVSSYILGDDNPNNRFILPDSTFIDSGEYLIVVRDSADFTTFFPEITDFVSDLSFNLRNSGDIVQLFDPRGILVDSAYPNPFNSSFTIPIEMDQDGGNVRIRMWNLLGHIVFEDRLTLGVGYHRYLFNDDNSELGLPAGMYILKVTHADYSHQQKVILVK